MIKANKKYKIFIVEDDEFLLDMYVMKFNGAGFEVEVAKSGALALEKLKDGYSPDVVLFDIVMPNVDGFELLERIKKENLAPESLFVALSNLGEKQDMERCLGLGADDYIIKAHFTPKEVFLKVEALLKKKNGAQLN